MPNIPYKDGLGNTRYLKNNAAGTDGDPDRSPIELLVDSLETSIGEPASTLAATDTGTFSLISLFKRLLQKGSDSSATTGNITAVDAASVTTAGNNAQSNITGTPTASSFIATTINGRSSFTITVTGTFVGTLNFEQSSDGGATWVPSRSQVIGTSHQVFSTTTIGVFSGSIGSSTNLRVRATAFTSGTAVITIQVGIGVRSTYTLNPLRLFDALSGALATIKAANTPATAADTAIVVDVRSYPAPVSQTVTIASSASLSGGISLNNGFLLDLVVPSNWTTANITFQKSFDGGATYVNARTSGGSEITVNVVALGESSTINPMDFAGCTHIKLRSGLAATPVNQASATTLTIVTRGAL